MSERPTEDASTDAAVLRLAAREGLLPPALVEEALRRHPDPNAAMRALIADGALPRERLDELKKQVDAERRPTTIGPYAITEVLGSGGMGVVYRAIDPVGGELAVKVLSPQWAADEYFRQRFVREAHVASTLSSPFVVAYRGSGDDDGRLFLAMELMPGGNAEQEADRNGGRLEPARALAICRDAAEGLEALHAAGLLHRDIKPDNIFLDGDGRAKLGDLGLARSGDQQGERLTIAGRTVGTPAFMAPEQAKADPHLDIRADIYALGATLYYLLVGRPPFVGSSAWLVMSQALAKPLPDPRLLREDCPAALASVVLRAGSLAREERYATPSEMRQDLEAALRGAILPRSGSNPGTAVAANVAAAGPAARRILIVDDDPMLRRMQRALFTASGYAVEVAEDGGAALAAIAAFRPTILLLDLVLPVLDGAEVIRRVRADPAQRGLAIVVLSNAFFEEELAAARAAGADAILCKASLGPRQVVAAVDRILMDGVAAPGSARPAIEVEGPAARELAERSASVLAALDALAERVVASDGADRAALEQIADLLRPFARLAAAAQRAEAATLASAAESLARQLHGWPHHLNRSSAGTLAHGVAALRRSLARPGGEAPPSAAVFVVDDDSISRQAMIQSLRKVGLRVESASDGAAALAALKREPFALVLSDVMMDGMNGFQLASALRLLPGYASVPVVFVTGLAGMDQAFQASVAAGTDVIAKPFLPMELAIKVLAHLVPI